MKKKFKFKRKVKRKSTIYILLIIMLIIISKYYFPSIKSTNSNSNFINSILSTIGSNYSDNNIISKVFSYIKDEMFNSPTFFLKSEIEYDNQNKLSSTKFSYVQNDIPLVYIYNSHQGETYSYKYIEEYNIIPDVKMASNMLKEKLESINIKTIVEDSDILGYMKENNLNHAGSYIASRHFLTSAIEKYSSVMLYIDLHRDAAPHSTTYTTINGKACAKILFVIGLEYDTYEQNLAIVTELNNIVLNKYPSLTRGIMKKEGYGVNGVYNQDLKSNVILIEIGGNENNIDEVNNTLDIIAQVIGEYINEKK